MNMVAMGFTDYTANNRCSWEMGESVCTHGHKTMRNLIFELISDACGVCFTLEAIIKIIDMGLILEKDTFLRDYENVVDFIVVISFLIELLHEYTHLESPFINLNMLRILRILRPLRVMKSIPSLRKQISAVFASVKGLINVVVFILLTVFLFSIIGQTLFHGDTGFHCRSTVTPVLGQHHW